MPSDIPETYSSEDRSVPSPLPLGTASFFPFHLLAQCGRGRLVGSPGPGPISPIRQAASSVVFYAPIMCEILPIRERLSTRKNADFKTHFLLWDYESPLRSLEVEHFLKIQFASHLETHLLCFPPSVLGRGGGRLEPSRILASKTWQPPKECKLFIRNLDFPWNCLQSFPVAVRFCGKVPLYQQTELG